MPRRQPWPRVPAVRPTVVGVVRDGTVVAVVPVVVDAGTVVVVPAVVVGEVAVVVLGGVVVVVVVVPRPSGNCNSEAGGGLRVRPFR
jgi:hypothetical protein